ncbi:hypothetical protein GUJ93_ZPchr0001g32535 [Zizania palustris]|uniref:Uncharacterized protein n=1 Tax=Zizania palustris TaxID=103762 RepID=A0A8J5R762_ZIZPA|nr:hypothetical protein GUJ93_ZPchr0001g32535 [Zizania palustris]
MASPNSSVDQVLLDSITNAVANAVRDALRPTDIDPAAAPDATDDAAAKASSAACSVLASIVANLALPMNSTSIGPLPSPAATVTTFPNLSPAAFPFLFRSTHHALNGSSPPQWSSFFPYHSA